MTKDEALTMALEFCEFCWRDVSMNEYALERLEQTTNALREALAQQDAEAHLQAVSDFGQLQEQEQEANAVATLTEEGWMWDGDQWQRPAQSEQEPVVWMVYTQDGQSVYVTDNPADIQEGQRVLPLYTGETNELR